MTYSIVARCEKSGAFGIAITSSSICVPSRCAWVGPLGAVVTQNLTNPALGPAGLQMLRQGMGAKAILTSLIEGDPSPAWRQVAVVDRYGEIAFHSGEKSGPVIGLSRGLECFAFGNILANSDVPVAMTQRFDGLAGMPLAERLLQALEAGLKAGGETVDERSAGLHVCQTHDWPVVDLRVDWHPEPVEALRTIWEQYEPQAHIFLLRAHSPEKASLLKEPTNKPSV